jgi:NADH-quinone oxidoreductase subunit G
MTKGPITACSTPITDGMVVRTRSPIAQKAQRGIFEFLLANHPLDCPICDRGGECPLQDQTFAYGPGTSRYIEPKRHHVKPIALGPTIALDRERCVLCWRCVRFCSEVAEDKSIILLSRGDHSMVGTFQDEPYVSNFSGNVIELCPVGALTSRKQRFNFRPWELQNRPSVCPHCPMGCNINMSVRKNDEVIRFLSRDNPGVDDSWLCDRGRFGFEFINSPERLASPLVRRDNGYEETSWHEAFQLIASRVQGIVEEHGPGAVAGIASPRLTNEDLFTFKRFMNDVIGSPHVDHFPRPQVGLTTSQAGAMARLGQAVVPISTLDRSATILLLGADPSRREPVMELRVRLAVNRHGAKLVVINQEETALDSKANASHRYEAGSIAATARTLAAAVRGEGTAQGPLSDLAANYLQSGEITLLYDDSFEGVTDKGDALAAIDELVTALAVRGEVGVIPMLDDCNSMGARDLGITPISASGDVWGPPEVDRLLAPNGPRAAFVFGANLARDVPGAAEAMRNLDFLVVSELMLTQTARLADVILPAASFAEKRGTFTNTERRVQALSENVPSPGIARADWDVLTDLSQYFANPLEYAMPEDVWNDIRRVVPVYANITYGHLGNQGALASAPEMVAGGPAA